MTNMIFRTVLAMSVSGSLLILALLGGKHLFKNICSRQWQYYIWLIVILRLLLPFGPEIGLMGNFYQTFGQAMVQDIPASSQENQPQERLSVEKGKVESAISVFLSGMGLLWLIIALGMLIRKITAYQSFLRYVMAGAEPVSDIALLEELAAVEKQMGMKRKMELCVNPLLSSPTLTGMFRPCIVLPNGDISPKDFRYIVFHELVHCKRCDILYKWLVQTVVCLHWFNPLVHVMSREIANACEFSCDEAVVAKMGYENAQDYGRALLDAMAAVGKHRGASNAVTLSANKQLLKERLGAIMSCGEKSGKVRVLTIVLTMCIVLGTVFVGIFPTQAGVVEPSETGVDAKTYPLTMYVNCLVCKVRDGAGEEFKVVGLMAEEEEVTVLEMIEGSGNRSWYRIDKKSLPEDMDISAEECYIRSDLLREK
ncbi:MAG: peptidase, M56 family protein [Lachnospiraceae bacterium]|nr:peptidase, M56 family protein [Lachnospiraceae bacterium]